MQNERIGNSLSNFLYSVNMQCRIWHAFQHAMNIADCRSKEVDIRLLDETLGVLDRSNTFFIKQNTVGNFVEQLRGRADVAQLAFNDDLSATRARIVDALPGNLDVFFDGEL